MRPGPVGVTDDDCSETESISRLVMSHLLSNAYVSSDTAFSAWLGSMFRLF